MTAQFDEFVLWPKGNPYEAFRTGQTFHHHWGRTLTRADAESFAINTCNWLPLYMNDEFSRAEGHPESPVSPALLLSLAVGMSVEDLSEGGGPFLGVNDVAFVRAVYPGETVYATSTVLDTRESQSKPDFGIVTWATELRSGIGGDVVLRLRRTNLVKKAATEKATAATEKGA